MSSPSIICTTVASADGSVAMPAASAYLRRISAQLRLPNRSSYQLSLISCQATLKAAFIRSPTGISCRTLNEYVVTVPFVESVPGLPPVSQPTFVVDFSRCTREPVVDVSLRGVVDLPISTT